MKAFFTLAKLLALTAVAKAGTWSCIVDGGGPGSDRVAEAVVYYENVFGPGEHDIPSLFTQGVRCRGLSFSVTNNVGYTTQDTLDRRYGAIDAADQIGDGKRCSYAYETTPNESYEYGNDDDFSCGALGGTATCACDIRDCDGNVLVGGDCWV